MPRDLFGWPEEDAEAASVPEAVQRVAGDRLWQSAPSCVKEGAVPGLKELERELTLEDRALQAEEKLRCAHEWLVDAHRLLVEAFREYDHQVRRTKDAQRRAQHMQRRFEAAELRAEEAEMKALFWERRALESSQEAHRTSLRRSAGTALDVRTQPVKVSPAHLVARRRGPKRAAGTAELLGLVVAGHVPWAEMLLASGEVDLHEPVDQDNHTVLHMAVSRNNLAMVRLLTRASAELEAVSSTFGTALHVASHFGFVPMVEHLLSVGARANAVNSMGSTPAQLAVEQGHVAALRLLMVSDAEAIERQRA